MPQFYTPESQDGASSMAIVIRTNGDPGAIARQATALTRAIDPEQPCTASPPWKIASPAASDSRDLRR